MFHHTLSQQQPVFQQTSSFDNTLLPSTMASQSTSEVSSQTLQLFEDYFSSLTVQVPPEELQHNGLQQYQIPFIPQIPEYLRRDGNSSYTTSSHGTVTRHNPQIPNFQAQTSAVQPFSPGASSTDSVDPAFQRVFSEMASSNTSSVSLSTPFDTTSQKKPAPSSSNSSWTTLPGSQKHGEEPASMKARQSLVSSPSPRSTAASGETKTPNFSTKPPKHLTKRTSYPSVNIPSPLTIKPVDFGDYLNIIKPHSSALRVSRTTFNGVSYTDYTDPIFLFHRTLLDKHSKNRQFILYNGDDSTDPVIALGTGVVKHRFAFNRLSICFPPRRDITYDFSAMYLNDDEYYRAFKFRVPGEVKAVTFRWKESSGNDVKNLGAKFMTKGMKLIRNDTDETVMAFVRPGVCEKRKTRQGERKGRTGFVGKRYGKDFETFALLTLLIMIDSHWDC